MHTTITFIDILPIPQSPPKKEAYTNNRRVLVWKSKTKNSGKMLLHRFPLKKIPSIRFLYNIICPPHCPLSKDPRPKPLHTIHSSMPSTSTSFSKQKIISTLQPQPQPQPQNPTTSHTYVPTLQDEPAKHDQLFIHLLT